MTPRRPCVSASRRFLQVTLGTGLAAALTLALTVAPGRVPPAGAVALPEVQQAAAAAQCDLGLGTRKGSDRRKAADLMAGLADLGKYGYFRLAKDPDWGPESTLDSSGNGHQHSLHYLLPLLRQGVRTGDTAMVRRFSFLLRDWIGDNRPGGPSSRYAWGPPIYEGFRSLVLVCAAAGPRGQARWLRKALVRHGELMADSGRYEGVNNASLHQSMGLYAIGATLGRPSWRRLAIAREAALAVRLVHPDGSDEEGALQYAVNNYRWFRQAAERLRRAGDPVPAELYRVDATPGFIVHATRPDGLIEALGDTSPTPLSPGAWLGTAAEFAATGGATGTPPGETFASFAGGYVFGRSGWGGAGRPLADETYFSVRAGGSEHIPHAHDDAGALTLYSHGSPLLFDTGQWRYSYGTTRSFVVSRAAHNAVLVTGVGRTTPRPQLGTVRADGLDITTVVDRGYRDVTLTRTVAYDRPEDVLVVWDRLSSARPVRASQQWGLGRDRVVRLHRDVAHTRGPGANVSLLFTAGGAPLDVARGRVAPLRGWNSREYGELSPAPSVRASQRGTELSWLTVIAPRAAGVRAGAVDATASVSATTATVSVRTAAGSATVTLDDSGGSRTARTAVTPAAVPGRTVLLAGDTTSVRTAGLAPRAPATLQWLPVGGSDWTPLVTGTATAAGTLTFVTSVPATADFRVVSEPGESAAAASAPVRLIAAVPPAPPVVLAAPAGDGRVTVSWEASAETGGVPLTRFAVRVGQERVVAGPDERTVTVSGLRAGARVVRVRAGNEVARSPWAAVPVAVPAYPSIDGPTRVAKGTRVTLRLAGLLSREPVTVTVTTVKNGSVRTLLVAPTAEGAATVRLRVRSTVGVVATSGGVVSAPHPIRVR